MNDRVYDADQSESEFVDPIDVDEVVVVGFDWGTWLTSIGESALDASSWSVSTRLALGDGATAVTKSGMEVTPPGPTTSPSNITAAHVWCTSEAADGDEVLATNTVRVGSRVKQRSLKMEVRSL